MIVSNQSNVSYPADRDSKGNLKFAIAQIRSSGPQNKREIVRYAQKFAIIHAHTDQHFGLLINFKRTLKIMIFQQKPDGGIAVNTRYVGNAAYGTQVAFYPAHNAGIIA